MTNLVSGGPYHLSYTRCLDLDVPKLRTKSVNDRKYTVERFKGRGWFNSHCELKHPDLNYPIVHISGVGSPIDRVSLDHQGKET